MHFDAETIASRSNQLHHQPQQKHKKLQRKFEMGDAACVSTNSSEE